MYLPRLRTFVSAMSCAVASPLGNVSVFNNCSFPVYWTSVQDNASPQQVLSHGQSYTEQYRYKYRYIDNTEFAIGVSIKLSTSNTMSPLTQIEYTYDPRVKDAPIYYDVSSVNDSVPWQFYGYGLRLQPSIQDCASVICRPGADRCYEGYINPFDDWATKGCDSSASIVVTLCPSGLESCR